MRRHIVIIFAAAALSAPSATTSAHHRDMEHDGGKPLKSFTTSAYATHHWGFGFYLDVPAHKVESKIPPGFTLEACRPKGSPLPPGKAHVVLVVNEEVEKHGENDLTFARFAILTCGRPPADAPEWYAHDEGNRKDVVNTRLIALNLWENSEEHIKFLKDYKQRAEYAEIAFSDDQDSGDQDIGDQDSSERDNSHQDFNNWSFTATAGNKLIARATFSVPTFDVGVPCLQEFDEILRLWAYDPQTRAFGTFDADIHKLRVCFGVPPVVTADQGTPLAELLGTSSIPTLAGIERQLPREGQERATHEVTYSRLF